jgi:tetratricopeptide (TPR) repeat protein
MKALRLWLLLLLAILRRVPLSAQEEPRTEMARAAALNDRGEFHAAALLLEPLLQPNAHALGRAETGDAWNLLGKAYLFLGEYENARRSFEAAIKVLKDCPGQIHQYAAALNNLGSVELEEGQTESSKILRQKAKQLYQAEGNHTGVARVASNLALIAVQQDRYKDARGFIAEAFQEARVGQQPETNDLAAMYSVQCAIAGHDKDWTAALDAVQREIDLMENLHGPRYFLLASAYALRGQVYGKLREYQKAENDLQNALGGLEKSRDGTSPLYLEVEVAYARVLRDSGSKKEASRLEEKARHSLEELRHRQCTGCSVNVLSLR